MTKEGIEGGGDNDCWEHEGNSSEGTQEGFAVKVEAGEEVGGGESEEECEDGGEDGLVKRKK